MSKKSPKPESPSMFIRMLQWIFPKISTAHVRIYRALGGRIVNRNPVGPPVLLLTTTGRRSGQPRTVAVGHLRDGDDVIVAGSNGGLPPMPAWVLNLRAHSEAEVELGRERIPVRAEWLEGVEFEQQWKRLVTAYPLYGQAPQLAGREVPLIRLRRVAASSQKGS
jgi:deazaflavin-dependent oxidoreductase (nitroreductase family)